MTHMYRVSKDLTRNLEMDRWKVEGTITNSVIFIPNESKAVYAEIPQHVADGLSELTEKEITNLPDKNTGNYLVYIKDMPEYWAISGFLKRAAYKIQDKYVAISLTHDKVISKDDDILFSDEFIYRSYLQLEVLPLEYNNIITFNDMEVNFRILNLYSFWEKVQSLFGHFIRY